MEEVCESPSRGFRGSGVCMPPIGLGLEGSPGLIGGGEMKVRVIASCCTSELPEEFKMPAREPALESGGDKCLSRMSGGLICTACRTAGKGSWGGLSLFVDVEGLDLLFFDRLLASASLIAAISLSLSSSSLVFRRPLSLKMGISSTSSKSS